MIAGLCSLEHLVSLNLVSSILNLVCITGTASAIRSVDLSPTPDQPKGVKGCRVAEPGAAVCGEYSTAEIQL